MENDLEIIERDLITRFRKDIYRPFCKALDKYDILKDGDKIALRTSFYRCNNYNYDEYTIWK